MTEIHEITSRALVQEVVKRPLLVQLPSSHKTLLITDASEFGIEALLEQEGLPMICISRLLNEAEQGYSQTQKETIAVV